MKTKTDVPEKTIVRLLVYRRLLLNLKKEKKTSIFSHQVAQMTEATPVQVRRDFMQIGYFGSPVYGYNIDELIKSISEFVDDSKVQKVALVGVGNLGRAVIDYLKKRPKKLKITALFDNDPVKVGTMIGGVQCYSIEQMQKVLARGKIRIAIIAVPETEAQNIAEKLVENGVTGILNYTPVNLILPPGVFVENRDMLLAIEKVAFFSRRIKR